MRSTTVALALAVFALVGCGGSADNPTSAGSNSINSTNDSVNSTVDEQAAEGMQLVTLRLPGMT